MWAETAQPLSDSGWGVQLGPVLIQLGRAHCSWIGQHHHNQDLGKVLRLVSKTEF